MNEVHNTDSLRMAQAILESLLAPLTELGKAFYTSAFYVDEYNRALAILDGLGYSTSAFHLPPSRTTQRNVTGKAYEMSPQVLLTKVNQVLSYFESREQERPIGFRGPKS